MIITIIFSFSTLCFIDLGSIARNIVYKIDAENTIEFSRYFAEWFVVSFGGSVGTVVIYYVILDSIIIFNTLIVKHINRLKNKLNKKQL
jgi:hypothetical protein